MTDTSDTRPTRLTLLAMAIGALLAVGAVGCAPGPPRGEPPPTKELLISAASSLSFALPELAARYEAKTGTRLAFNVASTGQLCQQIEQGAPVDVLLAADKAYVDELDARGLVARDSRAVYALGRLVLWTLGEGADHDPRLAELSRKTERRLAIANPRHAPYGIAAQEALRSLGLWESRQGSLILAENARQALQFAETGDVDFAIVPLSLALRTKGRYTTVPASAYRSLEQTCAIIAGSRSPEEARRFRDFLLSGAGRAILDAHGFSKPTSAPAPTRSKRGAPS